MITMAEPCTACVITAGLMRETLDRFEKLYPGVAVSIVELKHPNEIKTVEGLEVEKFPALMIDGVQVSAGNIVTVRQLESMVTE